MACTAVADDNGMRALRDVAAVVADIEYRVIGAVVSEGGLEPPRPLIGH